MAYYGMILNSVGSKNVPRAVYVPPHVPTQIPNTMCNLSCSLGLDRPRREAKLCHLVPKLGLRRSIPPFPTGNNFDCQHDVIQRT